MPAIAQEGVHRGAAGSAPLFLLLLLEQVTQYVLIRGVSAKKNSNSNTDG